MSRRATFSTGYDHSKLYTYSNLWKYYRRNEHFATRDYEVFRRARETLQQHVGPLSTEIRVLEVGSGQRFAVTLLLHSSGVAAAGIDVDYVDPTFSPAGFLGIWHHNGFERFLKSLVRHLLFDKTYYVALAEQFGKPLRWDGVDIRRMNVCNLSFPDNSFDYVFSHSVFEHIEDVERAAEELARALKKGGIADLDAHLYPSISGGHNLEWLRPDEVPSTKVPPWDHLRDNQYPAFLYLNQLREGDYLDIFGKQFSLLHVESVYEGEQC